MVAGWLKLDASRHNMNEVGFGKGRVLKVMGAASAADSEE